MASLTPQVEFEHDLDLEITWEGQFSHDTVISRFRDVGDAPSYDGEDYGLYQVYGEHILSGPNALLYVGRATQQTFSNRIAQHAAWLHNELAPVAVYLGRMYNSELHDVDDDWAKWRQHAKLAECILIHKYSPHYNSLAISDPPSLSPYQAVRLWHRGSRHRLDSCDRAPNDW